MKKEIHAEASSRLIFYLGDERLLQMKQFIQHGDVSTYDHCLLVAYYSFLWMRKLHIRCSEDELIRGALLHDYYLYDWHEKEKWHRMHGFRHPGFALSNAQRDFELSEKEKEIIRKHMDDGWIPVEERLPEEAGTYIINALDGERDIVTFAKWQNGYKRFDMTGARSYWRIIAWRPLPEPYRTERSEK